MADALNGLPESLSDGAVNVARSFSGYGELDGVSYAIGSSTPYRYALTRDGAGRITRKQETVSGGMATYDYTYDDAGRLAGVTKKRDGRGIGKDRLKVLSPRFAQGQEKLRLRATLRGCSPSIQTVLLRVFLIINPANRHMNFNMRHRQPCDA